MFGSQLILLSSLAFSLPGGARSFDLTWHSVDSGGATSTGGGFSVAGTIGQPDGQPAMAGGGYSLQGGFWAIAGGDAGSPCPPDYNGDGIVDGADLAFLLGAWNFPGGDLDGDGVTGPSDLALLLGSWGPC